MNSRIRRGGRPAPHVSAPPRYGRWMSGKLAERAVVVTLTERVSDDAFGGPVRYPAGRPGTIVSVHAGDAYTVEFCDELGRTLALVD